MERKDSLLARFQAFTPGWEVLACAFRTCFLNGPLQTLMLTAQSSSAFIPDRKWISKEVESAWHLYLGNSCDKTDGGFFSPILLLAHTLILKASSNAKIQGQLPSLTAVSSRVYRLRLSLAPPSFQLALFRSSAPWGNKILSTRLLLNQWDWTGLLGKISRKCLMQLAQQWPWLFFSGKILGS